MTDAEIRAVLEGAVVELIETEHRLLKLDVGEQAIAHHLCKYIEMAVPSDLNVDVEYNRHGSERKILLLPPKDAPDQTPEPTVVRPDIVVHIRGEDVQNLLVIEVKKPGQDLTRDRQKLEAFRQQYRYRNAAHVIVGYHKGQLVHEVFWVDG